MANKIESSQSAAFTRSALLEGNRDGKMPVPVGKWVWPASALALALATVWSSNHIEAQVNQAAPKILGAAGVNPSDLKFDADYRHVNVSGIVPDNVSVSHMEMVLAKYDGLNGENIRTASVFAKAPVSPIPVPAAKHLPVEIQPPAEEQAIEPQREDVRISAVVDYETITLSGNVPSQGDATILIEAAENSFMPHNVIDQLIINGKPARKDGTELHINNLATVISNLDSNIIDAHIDIDNDLLTGNITVTDSAASNRVKAFLPASMIGVITDAGPTVSDATPEQVTEFTPTISDYVIPEPTIYTEDQISPFENIINDLESDIRAHIVFAPASNILQASATDVLDKIVEALHIYPDTSLEIGGHTDSQSSAEYNLALSLQRATAVADYIASRGIETSRLMPAGLGESQPIASNNTKTGRAQNRRVEFRVY